MIRDEFLDKCLEALEKVVDQGKPSMDKDGSCLYRCEGLRCAVGWMISDDDYVSDMETNTILLHRYLSGHDMTCLIAKAAGAINGCEVQLLSVMQDAHDDCNRERALTFGGKVVARFTRMLTFDSLDAIFTEDQANKVKSVLGKLDAIHNNSLNVCS